MSSLPVDISSISNISFHHHKSASSKNGDKESIQESQRTNLISESENGEISKKPEFSHEDMAFLDYLRRIEAKRDNILTERGGYKITGWNIVLFLTMHDPNFTDAQSQCGVRFALEHIQDIHIDFRGGDQNRCLSALEILSQKEDVNSIRILADRVFSANPKKLIEKLSIFFNNNASLSKVEHLNLKLLNINNYNLINLLGKMLVIKNIIKLELSGNRIGSQNAKNLSNNLKNSIIEELHIDYTELGNDGLKIIANGFPKGLRFLNIGSNRINNKGAQDFLDILRKSKTTLESVDFSGNTLDKRSLKYLDIKNDKGRTIQFIFKLKGNLI